MLRKQNYITLLLVVLGMIKLSFANQPLDQPQVNCISVDATGDITITWDQVPNPFGVFDQYEVYDASNNLVSSVGAIGTTSATIAGAGGNSGSKCFYVVASATSAQYDSPQSTTSCSIYLQVINPGDGTAILSWNNISSPNPPSSSGWYMIYSEFPAGTWTLIDSVSAPTTQYRDTITVCDSWLNYRVEMPSSAGCNSVSNVDGEQFQDMLPPSEPVISSVTVDTSTGNAIINWNVNPSDDTEGYILLHFIPGSGWVIIDTIWGINNTSYTNLNSSANTTSEGYGLAAFDSCWSGLPAAPNTSPMGTPHFSMWLRTGLNICGRQVRLTWSPYLDWPNGVQSYKIYASKDGGPYNLVGNNAGNDTTFIHSNVTRGSNYSYVIRSESSSGNYALSNLAAQFINGPTLPTYGYLRTATVTGENSVKVRYEADQSASVSHYRLERSTTLNGNYDEIALGYPGTNPVTFTDTEAATQFKSYYYRVVTVDSCGEDVHISNPGRTILLNVTADSENLVNRLTWSEYEEWDGVVTQYEIYRSINGVYDPAPIAVVPSSNNSYTDNVSDYINTSGEFCYYIKAIESTNSYGLAEYSNSNSACGYQDPLVWIPTGMVVNGYNNVFKAEAGFVRIDSYHMRIFNRWGQLLFETKDINEGWDGSFRGQTVKEGVYVYYISYKAADGAFVERRGTVTVIN